MDASKLGVTCFAVVSDSVGFIGAFDSEAKLAEACADKPSVLVQLFELVPGHSTSVTSTDASSTGASSTDASSASVSSTGASSEWVWLVPLAANGYIAFASNSREVADRVRVRYAAAGFAFDEDIDWAQQRMNVVRPEAVARYSAVAPVDFADPSEDMLKPRPGGPLEKAIADNMPFVGVGHFVVSASDFVAADQLPDNE